MPHAFSDKQGDNGETLEQQYKTVSVKYMNLKYYAYVFR